MEYLTKAIEKNTEVMNQLIDYTKKLQAENKQLREQIKKAIKFIDETPRHHDARDTVIDAIKYNLEQTLKENE